MGLILDLAVVAVTLVVLGSLALRATYTSREAGKSGTAAATGSQPGGADVGTLNVKHFRLRLFPAPRRAYWCAGPPDVGCNSSCG